MNMRFTFDDQKAIEAITYIAGKIDNASFFTISKSMYYADLAHLEKYGTPVFGDNYIAMKYGPVPSKAYDMMKCDHPDYKPAKAFKVSDRYNVTPIREPNLDHLSQTDIEALDASIEKVGGKSFDQLSNESHDAAWDSVDQNGIISLDAMIDMLPNSAVIKDYIAIPD